jgi:hypothetical protein
MPGAGELGVPLEEVREVLVGLLDGLLLRRRGVDRHPQTDVAVTGMTGLAPGRAVVGDAQPQLGDVEIAQADEQRQPEARDDRKRLLRVGGHPQRRVRQLIGARAHQHVVEVIELAVVAEPLALPGLQDDRQRLLESPLALAVGHAQHVVGAR